MISELRDGSPSDLDRDPDFLAYLIGVDDRHPSRPQPVSPPPPPKTPEKWSSTPSLSATISAISNSFAGCPSDGGGGLNRGRRDLRCLYCSLEAFGQVSELMTHVRETHPYHGRTVCPVCGTDAG